ncbi:alpha/beta hydrolase family protein [Verrucomicrobiota bacterium sgz303538]
MNPVHRLFPVAMVLASQIATAAPAMPDPANLPSQPSIPDPLVTTAGERVASKDQWLQARRGELQTLVQNYEYGFLPAKPETVDAKVLHSDPQAFGGKATLREVQITWGKPEGSIQLLLVTPNARQKPAPVFLGLNFTGNHTLVTDPKVRLPEVWMRSSAPGTDNRANEADRGKNVDTWNIEQSIDRGYAVATFFNGDVIPDEPQLAEEALRKFRADGANARGASDAGTIAAWAWCLQRAVDYLVTNPDIDAKRVAMVGHSRNGKTALLAAAFDERVAMVIPSQAGCGGTSPARVSPDLAQPQKNGRPSAETVGIINKNFPHWFCGNFKAFNEAPEKLPYDHHAMIALCAPRPVLLSNAAEDTWANPAGQFDMLKAADSVYRLVAGDGLSASQMPELGKLIDSRLGYFIRPGKHSMNKTDWDAWLDYADKWLK